MSDYVQDDDYDLPLFSAVNTKCIISESTKPISAKHSEKMLDILRELELRDLTCVEVESRWHRGQAAIGSLRELGYVIHTKDQAYHYTGRKQEMVKAKPLQDMYYKTKHWIQKSKERKEFDGGKCVQCRTTAELEAHHWRYDLFNEQLYDLTTLCKRCHDNMHTATSGSSVHFPRYITEAVAERIRNDGVDN
jgi:5-methylcytosine-specific restriction endonuclease McrA